MSYKWKSTLGLAVVAALILAACGSPSPSPASTQRPKVRIIVGGLEKIIYLPAMLTKQLGYFEQEGVDVELLSEAAGVEAEVELVAGNIEGVVGFYDHSIDLQGKGKFVESVVQLDWVPGEAEMVATRKASEIKSPADFKNRPLGVTGIGSSTDLLTHYLGVKAGVPVDQIKTIAVGAGNTFITAIKTGKIDAGMTTQPTIARLLKSGDAQILVNMQTPETTRAALGGTYPAACLYMRNDWVQSHKDTVQKLANAFVRTLKWIHTHSANEITDKMPTDYYANDKELYLKALEQSLQIYSPDGKMPPDGPPTVLKVLQSFDENVKGKTIDLSKTYTTEFVTKAK